MIGQAWTYIGVDMVGQDVGRGRTRMDVELNKGVGHGRTQERLEGLDMVGQGVRHGRTSGWMWWDERSDVVGHEVGDGRTSGWTWKDNGWTW